MIFSNMGTICLSLPALSHSVDATITQVRVLSLSNTLSRIFVGPFADFISPSRKVLRRHRVSRISFLFAASSLLFATSLWMVTGVRSQTGLWGLRWCPIPSHYAPLIGFSIGTGVAYGGIFTVLYVRNWQCQTDTLTLWFISRPSIISSIWGVSNRGRNYGIITYAPFLGTPIYSYLYAFISLDHASDGKVCKGRTCWLTTFKICACSAMVGIACSALLWRKWKGRL